MLRASRKAVSEALTYIRTHPDEEGCVIDCRDDAAPPGPMLDHGNEYRPRTYEVYFPATQVLVLSNGMLATGQMGRHQVYVTPDT